VIFFHVYLHGWWMIINVERDNILLSRPWCIMISIVEDEKKIDKCLIYNNLIFDRVYFYLFFGFKLLEVFPFFSNPLRKETSI
jgi:hypothetical protein